jgi:hypothetical protein
MKQVLKGEGLMLVLLMFLNCMKKNENDLINFACRSNIEFTFTLNTIIYCSRNIVRKKNKSRIKKFK